MTTISSAAPVSTVAVSAALSTSGPGPERAIDEFARIPLEAAAAAREALAALTAAPAPDSPHYLAFRRAVARGEPFFRGRGFMSEALFGAGLVDEIGGPMGQLHDALVARDAPGASEAAGEADRALRLLADSFERSPAKRAQARELLPRAAFALGAAFAGSRPGSPPADSAVVADAHGLLDAIELGIKAYSILVSPTQEFAPAAARVHERIASLRAALAAAEKAGALAGRAALVLSTGWLGADLRTLLGPDAWTPYAPQVPAGSEQGREPLSVLTLPRLRRAQDERSKTDEDALAALGERLFFDKGLSQGGDRSCATCHVPSKGYADGRPRAASLDPLGPKLRHTPSLLYASLHAAQFWDGRALSTEKQAHLVMHSRQEMGGIDRVFPRPDVATVQEAAAALAVFQSLRLVPGSSPLDRFARGDEQALSAEDRAGFDVFAGKGRCARCHVPPLFGGSHPPDFSTAIYAALGLPESPGGKTVDPDEGRGGVTRQPLDKRAFKTPTVRNVAKTAPYFHNGAFPTLESAIDFYDKGGGRGLGLTDDNQDPDVLPLSLTAAEKTALLRFLRVALGDAETVFRK